MSGITDILRSILHLQSPLSSGKENGIADAMSAISKIQRDQALTLISKCPDDFFDEPYETVVAYGKSKDEVKEKLEKKLDEDLDFFAFVCEDYEQCKTGRCQIDGLLKDIKFEEIEISLIKCRKKVKTFRGTAEIWMGCFCPKE